MSGRGVGSMITCVNCGGSGYVYTLGGNGMKFPRVCQGCQGTGNQTVRA